MKTTKRLFSILLVLLSFSLLSYSQERKIKISVQSGYFNAGEEYPEIKPGWNAGIDASYFLSNHLFLTAHFNYGKNKYYNKELSVYSTLNPHSSDGTNSNVIINNVGLLIGYNFPVTTWMNVSGQVGISQWIEVIDDYILLDHDYLPDIPQGGIIQVDKGYISAAFPVKFSIGFTPLKYLEIGLSGGFYVEPDYDPSFVGFYLGPQLSVLF
jgi:hypothetical protein